MGRLALTSVLLDTHAWAWPLTGDPRLSAKATVHVERADVVFVSPISFFEIGQKVRIGKWPEMETFVIRLPALLAEQGGRTASLTPEICLSAAMVAWTHRDPFDRILAATAMHEDLELISADSIFDELPAEAGRLHRLW